MGSPAPRSEHRPRAGRALRIVAGVGAALAALLAAAWLAAAEGALTGPAMRGIGAALGRDIAADGGLRLRLGRATRIDADDVRLANVPWGSRRDMLAARRVAIVVDTRSLFSDTIVVRQVAVDGLDLLLERNARGEDNWTFAVEDETAGSRHVKVEHASLAGARIRLVAPRLERPLDIDLAAAGQRLAGGRLELRARGAANATPLALRADLGLLPGSGRGFAFEIEGRVGEVELAGRGSVDSLTRPARGAGTIRLSGPDAGYVAARFGIRGLGTGPFALEASAAAAPDGRGLRGAVTGRIGGFEVAAQALAARDPQRLAVRSRIAGPDLALLGELAGAGGLPAEPFRLRVDLQASGAALRVDRAELDIDALQVRARGTLDRAAGGDAALEFDAAGPDLARIEALLGAPRIAAGPFAAGGRLRRTRDGGLQFELGADTRAGRLDTGGTLGAAPEFAGTRVRFTATGPSLAPLARDLSLPAPPAGAFRATGTAVWDGAGATLEDGRLAVGGDVLDVGGALGRPPLARGTDLRLALAGPSGARVGAVLGVDGLPATPYRASARVQRSGDAWRVTAGRLALAGATLQSGGTIGTGPQGRVELTLRASGPALERFAGLARGFELPSGRFEAAARLALADATLSLTRVDLALAGATVKGQVGLTGPAATGDLAFDVEAAGPDLARLWPALGEAAEAGRDFRLEAKGSRRQGRWSFDGLRFSGALGRLDAQGDVTFAPRFATRALRVEARTSSLRDAGRLFGWSLPELPAELTARFDGNGDDFALEELAGRAGASDFSGRGAVRRTGGGSDVEVSVASRVLDLEPWLQRAQPATKGRRGDRRLLIPATPLALPGRGGVTARLALRAGELRVGGRRFGELRLDADLRDGRLRLDPVSLDVLGGRLGATLELARRGQGIGVHLVASGRDLALGAIPFNAGGANPARYVARIDLRGAGATLRELAGSLTGELRMVGRGGRIANSRLVASSNDFLRELLSTLNPLTTRAETTEVVCVAYLLAARDGLVATDPALVMRTAEMDMVARGSVDLDTEKLDFSFRTAARKGLGLSVAQLVNPYIKVTGTLASPGLTLDPKGTLVSGGAAVATGGLSILATTAWERLTGAKDPCASAEAGIPARGPGP